MGVIVEALEPAEWTKGLVSRAKTFRHTYSLTKFIMELKALAQANDRANKDFDLGKPSLQKGKRGITKVFNADDDYGRSQEQKGHDDVKLRDPQLYGPIAALFMESAAQSSVYYGEEGPYTVTPTSTPCTMATRAAPRDSRTARRPAPRDRTPYEFSPRQRNTLLRSHCINHSAHRRCKARRESPRQCSAVRTRPAQASSHHATPVASVAPLEAVSSDRQTGTRPTRRSDRAAATTSSRAVRITIPRGSSSSPRGERGGSL